jgi:hypothetical protein
MELSTVRGCVYHDRMYPNASEVHTYMRSMICRDGQWHDTDEGSDQFKVSLAYIYH